MTANHPFLAHQTEFLLRNQQQGKSANTIAAYQRDLDELATMLPNTAQPISRDFIHAVQKLSMRGQSPTSIARKLSAWRNYAAFLVQRGILSSNPVQVIKAPKKRERLPKALNQETLNHLINSDEPNDKLSVRDHAIIELLYGSGLRLSEIVQLDLTDITLSDGWVRVLGKGNKERHVPLSRKSITAIQNYLAERHAINGETALFTGRHGKRLGQRQIGMRLQRWAIQNGSPQHISPHMLRHSYASHILQSSRDLRAVQELLGHTSIAATQIYTKLDFDHLARVYDETHPRAKRKKNQS